MAKSDGLPGITVHATVAGEQAVEYDPPWHDQVETRDEKEVKYQHTCTKYIEAIDDAEFAICLSVSEEASKYFALEKHGLLFTLQIDGNFVDKQFVDQVSNIRTMDSATENCSAAGMVYAMPLKFAPISICE